MFKSFQYLSSIYARRSITITSRNHSTLPPTHPSQTTQSTTTTTKTPWSSYPPQSRQPLGTPEEETDTFKHVFEHWARWQVIYPRQMVKNMFKSTQSSIKPQKIPEPVPIVSKTAPESIKNVKSVDVPSTTSTATTLATPPKPTQPSTPATKPTDPNYYIQLVTAAKIPPSINSTPFSIHSVYQNKKLRRIVLFFTLQGCIFDIDVAPFRLLWALPVRWLLRKFGARESTCTKVLFEYSPDHSVYRLDRKAFVTNTSNESVIIGLRPSLSSNDNAPAVVPDYLRRYV